MITTLHTQNHESQTKLEQLTELDFTPKVANYNQRNSDILTEVESSLYVLQSVNYSYKSYEAWNVTFA